MENKHGHYHQDIYVSTFYGGMGRFKLNLTWPLILTSHTCGKDLYGWLDHTNYKVRYREWRWITWGNSHTCITRTRKQSIVGSAFWTIQTEKRVFDQKLGFRNTGKYITLRYSLLRLNLLNNFEKEFGHESLLTFTAELCLVFSLWASRLLVYHNRNLWMVDLCSVHLRLWNWGWRGVDEAINSMAILQDGLNFIIYRCLCERVSPAWDVEGKLFLWHSKLVMFYCRTGYVMI